MLAAPSFSLFSRLACANTFFHRVLDIAMSDLVYLFEVDHHALSYHRLHYDRNFRYSDLTFVPLLANGCDHYQSNWTALVCLRIDLTSSSRILHWLSLKMLVQHLRHLMHLTPQTTPLDNRKKTNMSKNQIYSSLLFIQMEIFCGAAGICKRPSSLTLLLCKSARLCCTHLSLIF